MEDSIREYYIENWNSQEYHCDITRIMREFKPYFEFMLSFIHDVVKSKRFDGDKMLDLGSGPSVHNIASASAYFSNIIMSDLVEDNRKNLKKWLKGEPDLNWCEFLDIVAKIEGATDDGIEKTRREIESRIRKSVKAVVQCDVLSDSVLKLEELPEGINPPFDLIISVLCVDGAVSNYESFVSVLKRINNLLRLGGGLVLCSFESTGPYKIGDKRFHSITTNIDEILEALKSAGFGKIVHKTHTPLNPVIEDLELGDNITGCYCMASQKIM